MQKARRVSPFGYRMKLARSPAFDYGVVSPQRQQGCRSCKHAGRLSRNRAASSSTGRFCSTSSSPPPISRTWFFGWPTASSCRDSELRFARSLGTNQTRERGKTARPRWRFGLTALGPTDNAAISVAENRPRHGQCIPLAATISCNESVRSNRFGGVICLASSLPR